MKVNIIKIKYHKSGPYDVLTKVAFMGEKDWNLLKILTFNLAQIFNKLIHKSV